MKKMSIVLSLLFFIACVSSNTQTNSGQNFNYSGSNWSKYEGHRMTIVVLDTSVGGTRLIAEQIIRDGKFNVSANIKYPQNAFFGLYNPKGDFVFKKEFILEPEKLRIDLDSETNDIILTGGKYNPLFIKIEKNPEYLALVKAFDDFASTMKPEDFKTDTAKRKRYMDLNRAAYTYKVESYNDIRFNNPDPYARLLAMYHSGRSNKFEEQLAELEKELGSLPEIVYLRYSTQAARERQRNSGTVKPGAIIKDFNSTSFDGKPFHLANTLKENKYTLVEFWASWCGPCRAEIPHMKKAYQKFKSKGFEIVSFTLDHERDRWTKATMEEKLPWINVGDLLAYKSSVVKMFGISGIPANFLVDPSGKIIAMNLRQEKLDEKLADLLEL